MKRDVLLRTANKYAYNTQCTRNRFNILTNYLMRIVKFRTSVMREKTVLKIHFIAQFPLENIIYAKSSHNFCTNVFVQEFARGIHRMIHFCETLILK